LNISVALALEYEDVLRRQSLLPRVGEAQVDEFLNYLFKVSNLVPFVSRLGQACSIPATSLFWN
jgi:hypothetical protein